MKRMRGRWSRGAILAVVAMLVGSSVEALPVRAAPVPSIVYVAPTGSDDAGCGMIDAPCRTIQQAVEIASSYDVIRVAEGVYRYSSGASLPPPCYGGTTLLPVVCILNKELSIVGGYSTDDWSSPDAAAHPTIIDGEGQRRGLLLQRTSPTDPAASLEMEGFVIQNGLARGPDGQSGDKTFSFGGGLLADSSPLALNNMIFRNNRVVGGSTTAESYGGAGAGGGIAVRASPSATFQNVTFECNEAQGGYGRDRGGFGLGGALFVFRTPFYGRNLTLDGNMATGGSSSGSGVSGERADAHGGGAAFHESHAVLQYVVATDNTAIGGDAASYGGGAYGGAIMVQSAPEPASIILRDAELCDNLAIGGNAQTGGDAKGGAMETSNAPATLERVRAIHNTVQGGNGAPDGKQGSGGGGGFDFGGTARIFVSNSIISDNVVASAEIGAPQGGGGGGLWLYGVDAEIVHSTIARNRLASAYNQGQAAVLLQSASALFSFNIIEGHTSQSAVAALHVQVGNDATLNRTLWVNNSTDTNQGQPGAGTVINSNPVYEASARFVSPEAPSYDYHLASDSPAVDAAVGSTTTTDIDSQLRADGVADIGADELAPLGLVLHISRPGSGILLPSWQANANLSAVLDHYEVTVLCADGAHRPDQVACNTPLNVGLKTELLLTSLTNDKPYTIIVDAHTGSRDVFVSVRKEAVPGVFFHVFLPMVGREQ